MRRSFKTGQIRAGFLVASAFLLVLLVACAGRDASASIRRLRDAPATACKEVIPGCRARRLANIVLTGRQKSGALGSVDGYDLHGVLTFDEALRRAWANSTHEDAKTVQVILGSADASALRWGTGKRLFYAVDWGGLCAVSHGLVLFSCIPTVWGTVIDARTGAFIVEGS